MATDENYCGIPLAYILFSPKESTSDRGTHTGYTKDLLENLLGHWVTAMGTNEEGETFEPLVAITDNDVRKHHTLSTLFLNITLLLCLYHVWQVWRNALNTALAGIPKGQDRDEVWGRLARLCMRL